MMLRRLLLFLTLLACGCLGDEYDSITHLVLLDNFPASFGRNATPEIVIRTNYSGSIEFREADEFKVLLNTTAPSIQDAYAVSSEILEHKGKLLLQVFQKPQVQSTVTLQTIFMVVGLTSGIWFLLTVAYVIWWYTTGKHHDIYRHASYLKDRQMYRSGNSIPLGGAAANDPLVDFDDYGDGDEDGDRERKRQEKMRVSMKPETILEESEDSADDTNPKTRYQMNGSSKQLRREWSMRQSGNHLANENMSGSGFLDYPDQSGDELDNDLSPDQIIAGADGNYTPLDDIDDIGHERDIAYANSQSTAKLPDPRGNLDYNIQTSKSDGDLLGDNRKLSEKEKVIIPPLVLPSPKRKKSLSKDVPMARRAEPNIYQRGMNLRPQENDLSSSPSRSDRTKAQVHTPENPYVNHSHGQYISLQPAPKQIDPMSRSRSSRESNDAYELYTYPADIPMSTFKAPNVSPLKNPPTPRKVKVKPTPAFKSGSPNAFDFHKLEPKFRVEAPTEPISPGNFSMLSEGTSSSDSNPNDADGDDVSFYRLEDESDDDGVAEAKDGDAVSNDGSLPLPSPPPMSNQFMPYDTHGRISQLSPRQSLVSPGDSKDYGTMIALTGSPSPGGPFSKHSINQDRFVFPPPPAMFNPPQQTAWTRRELNFSSDDKGEYVGLPLDVISPPPQPDGRREEGRNRERRQSGGKKGGKPPKFLHLTLLATCCILSVISGVYCLNAHETHVHIVVYVPPTFPYRNATIYTTIGKTVDVANAQGMTWLLSPDPVLHNFNSTLCKTKTCAHGCDENNGQCICSHGYMMKNDKCTDINECQNGMARCPHPQAGCANTAGSYDCLCMGGYNLYSYNNLCLDCSAPCHKGSYEFQPCKGDKQKKVCKDCTKSCGDNYYMSKPCTESSDAECLMCRPICDAGENEFEESQCSAFQNRECKDKTRFLKAPNVSTNVILDDLAVVRDETVDIPFHPLDSEGVRRFNFERGTNGFGSEFWIEVEIKHFRPIAIFRSVDHADAVDPSDFTGNPGILKKCQYPVPSHYELMYIKHDDVSYKGNPNHGMAEVQPCADTRLANFPNLQQPGAGRSVFCSEPGILGDVFQHLDPNDYKSTQTVWEEKSESCRRGHTSCESCIRTCVQNMIQGCSVTADDDTGRSPRLPLCYKCCAEKDCSVLCRNYHNKSCGMVKCQRGNLVEFKLRPVYPTTDKFYCHVEQVPRQHLIKVDYKVKYRRWTNRIYLLYRNISVYGDEQWRTTGKTQKRDDIINIEIDSRLTKIPNFLQWAIGAPKIRVGQYRADGTSVQDMVASAQKLLIRPKQPFQINPRNFSQLNCEDITMKDVVMASAEEPYDIMSDLVALSDDNASYIISNKTIAQTAKIGLKKDTSILKAIFRPAKVKLGSLTGNLTYTSTHWIVMVTAETEHCPGFLNVNVSDPAYPDHPLYQIDVGVECPKQFHLTFSIPTKDSPLLSKNIQVYVKDVNATYMLTIHAPAQITQAIIEEQTAEPIHTTTESMTPVTSVPKESPAYFSILFIAVVSGIVLLLWFLLAFGVAWKQGVPEGKIDIFHRRLLFLLTIYITFQFLYSVMVSMFVFCHIVMAVNGGTTSFLKQFNQQRSVTSALTQLELDSMDIYLHEELRRQEVEASQRKTQCYDSIQKVIHDIHKLREGIEAEAVTDLKARNLKQLITSHWDTTLKDFASDLLQFRDKYDRYEENVLQKLSTEVENTYRSIEHSKWLEGAQYLYQYVEMNRNFIKKESDSPMASFMAWANMDTDMMQLAQGLTLPLPDLPNVAGKYQELNSAQPSYTRAGHYAPLSSQTINKWFVQPNIMEEPNNSTATHSTGSAGKRITSLNAGNYAPFFVAMAIIDILWLIHRMVKACGIGKLFLYGYPIYVDVRERKDGINEGEKKKLNKKSKLKGCRSILIKVISTMFIPKFIATVFVCLTVYFVSMAAHNFINIKTFTHLGYYNDMEDIMRISESAVNTRIVSSADRIGQLEYPMYEGVMTVNVQNHQYVLHLIESQWRAVREAHSTTYCNYLRKINVTANCEDGSEERPLREVRLQGCTFPPVVPRLYQRKISASSQIAESQMDAFLMNIRKLISDTCYVIIIYLSAIVIKELLGTVLWIYIKRSGLVTLRIIYETDQPPGSAESSTTYK